MPPSWGCRASEIARRADEIVAFADIGRVHRSAGQGVLERMFVRLAFAVTTSLDADVLLIDEALAVGDIFFRQKCYQRLAALREQGVAIVLVSHALNEVEQFCQRALLLQAACDLRGPGHRGGEALLSDRTGGASRRLAGTSLPRSAGGGRRMGLRARGPCRRPSSTSPAWPS